MCIRDRCYIDYTKTAVTETIEKCIIPMERICTPPQYGEVRMFFKITNNIIHLNLLIRFPMKFVRHNTRPLV